MTKPFGITFTVIGAPVPKQSFRYANGHGYQPERVTAWESAVAWAAAQAMTGRAPLTGPLRVELAFHLPSRRRVDCENLCKPILDSCRIGGVFEDDSQVIDLHVTKCHVGKDAGRVTVLIEELPDATP